MKLNTIPTGRQNDIVVQNLNNEVLIYDLIDSKAFCLNHTSALIWEFCDGKNNVKDITKLVGKKLKTPITEDFVWLALRQLNSNNLIDNSQAITQHFKGVSRREMIKKVGLTTMVALPVISSLVAPTAAMAQSRGTVAGGCDSATCNGNGQNPCTCPSVTCPAGYTIAVNVVAGVCASASAATFVVDADVNGRICLVANACIRIALP